MSLFQFRAAVAGWAKANGADEGSDLTSEDIDAIEASMAWAVERSAALNG